MEDRFRKDHWPKDVYAMSIDETIDLGVNRKTNELFWDGEKVKTRVVLGVKETVFAVLTVAALILQTVHPWLISILEWMGD